MKLWITYAWKDNDEGNFDYLVEQLAKIGIEAKFDKVALIPGQRLWEQIGDHIMNGDIDGWAYLITPNSLQSEPCREELAYALNRVLAEKADFPLIGLVHQVPFTDVPLSLRVRLCVPLSNGNWPELVKSGLERRPPVSITTKPQTRYIFNINQQPNASGNLVIVEFKPRFGQLTYWRIAVPSTTEILRWGFGPEGGGDNIAGVMHNCITGTVTLNDIPCNFVGTGDNLSPDIAAKVIFQDVIPEFIAFGVSNEPFGVNDIQYELYEMHQ